MPDVNELRLLLNGTLELAVNAGSSRPADLLELSRAAVALDHQPSMRALLSLARGVVEDPDVVSGGLAPADLRLLVDAFALLAGAVETEHPGGG